MDAAREAVHKFTSKVGHHTDVDEVVNTAVTRETIKPTRHEETTEAIDREVHQHHYHTTVQPIQHKEVLPEQHAHQMMPVENREFHHGDHDAVKRGVSAEIGQFADVSTVHQTQHTRSAAPTVSGEHVHHHVHETVQPVIHKETVQPEVVHTTIPIHEVHHAEATHHGISALPLKTLEEFTKTGGILHGSQKHTHEEYDGAPRPYNKDLQTTAERVLGGVTGHHSGGASGGLTGHNSTGGGLTDRTSTGGGLTDRTSTGSGLTGRHTSGGLTGNNTTGDGLIDRNSSGGYTDRTSTGSGLTGRSTSGGLTGNNTIGDGLTDRNSAGGYADRTSAGSGLTGHNTSGGLTDRTSAGSGYNDRSSTGSGLTGDLLKGHAKRDSGLGDTSSNTLGSRRI